MKANVWRRMKRFFYELLCKKVECQSCYRIVPADTITEVEDGEVCEECVDEKTFECECCHKLCLTSNKVSPSQAEDFGEVSLLCIESGRYYD